MLNQDRENEFCRQLIALSERTAGGDADTAIADFIERTYANNREEKAMFQSIVSDFAGFHETDDPRLQQLFSAADLRAQFVAEIMRDTGGNPEGVELQSSYGKYALLLRDASNPGKVRYQVFDERGFASHHTEDSWESAIADAYFSGFKTRVVGVLNQLSAKPAFFSGVGMA